MTNAIDNARKIIAQAETGYINGIRSERTTLYVVEALRDLLDSLEYEYAQGFEEDDEGTWYIGKSFGDDPSRPLDEGYSLVKRGLLPWEKVS